MSESTTSESNSVLRAEILRMLDDYLEARSAHLEGDKKVDDGVRRAFRLRCRMVQRLRSASGFKINLEYLEGTKDCIIITLSACITEK